MSNTYGGEPGEHEAGHEDVLAHEQDVVHEAPSDYEFADDHGAPIAEEHHEDHSSAESEPKAKGRSAMLPIAAAVGGVILLGGVAWWQFGPSGTAPKAAAPMTALSSTPEPNKMVDLSAAQDANAFPASTVAPTTNSADAANATATALPSPSPAPAAPMPMPPPATAMAATPMPQPAPSPIPVPSMPSNLAPGVATPAPMAAMPQNAPVAMQPQGAATDSRIDALSARMDDVQHSLDQTVQQLSQVTNMVAAGNNGGTKDIQDRLDKMEQQITAMHHPAPKLTSPAVLPGDAPVAANADLSHEAPIKTKIHHVTPTVHATHSKHDLVHHRELPTEPTKEAAAPGWILRAASPGEAWIAPNSSSHDLKQVQVGDTLPGIGKVKAISEQSGNWVVQGSTGSIQ